MSDYTYETLPHHLVDKYKNERDYEETFCKVIMYQEQIFDFKIMSKIPIKYFENFTDIGNKTTYSNKLYISDIDSAEDVEYLCEYNIKTVVYLGMNPKSKNLLKQYSEKSMTNYFYEINDHPDSNLFDILEDVYDKISIGLSTGNVMVHCMAGISRSVSAVLYFLLQSKIFTTMHDAMAHIRKYRIYADPNHGFLMQVYAKARLMNFISGELHTK